MDVKRVSFNCVEMKRKGAELVRQKLAGKTFEEQLQFWRQGTEELIKLQQEIKNKKLPK